jgi:hypothetical protein
LQKEGSGENSARIRQSGRRKIFEKKKKKMEKTAKKPFLLEIEPGLPFLFQRYDPKTLS